MGRGAEGVVYLASEKRRVKDRFRVFERAVSLGKELPDGKTADKNYVWFSDWQLQNINSNHLLPIDIEAYRKLKNHIAKALVPLLQVWLYATRDEGVFEKRYDELCDFLNIQRYRYLSLIRRTLGPSLDELKEFGYLADWQIEKTSDKQNYKILFYHGDKFHRDRNARLNRKRLLNGRDERTDGAVHSSSVLSQRQERHESYSRQQPPKSQPTPLQPTFNPQFVAEFTRRGITEQKAVELLSKLQPGQDVLAQLESAEQTVQQLQNTHNPVKNPAGFYIRLIERNTPVPDGFETNARRKAREEKERKEREHRAEEDAREELEWEYNRYCAAEVDRYIQANPSEFESLKNAKAAEERAMRPTSWSGFTETSAKIAAKSAIQQKLPLLSFEDFADHKKQAIDFSLKPVAVSPSADSAPTDLEPGLFNPDSAAGYELAAEKPVQAAAEEQKDAGQDTALQMTPPINSEPLILSVPDANPASPEPAALELVAIISPPEERTVDQIASADVTDLLDVGTEMGELTQVPPEPTIFPLVAEPATEVAAEPTEAELGSDTTEPHAI